MFTRNQINNNHLIETHKEFNFNQIAKKLVSFKDQYFFISLEKENTEGSKSQLVTSIMIYEKNGSFEDLIILEDKITRVNSLKIFEKTSPNENFESKYFLTICCDYNEDRAKGCLLIYEIVRIILKLDFQR